MSAAMTINISDDIHALDVLYRKYDLDLADADNEHTDTDSQPEDQKDLMSDEDTRTPGEKARDAKTPEQRKEAGGKASKRKKFFAEFRKIAESLGSREETNYSKIKKYFEDNVDWDWSEEYLRPQVYDATVNDMVRTSRWTKTPESHFDVFFAVNGSRRKRIALGSGTSVQEVNQLIKQFSQMGKMMKMMQGGGAKQMMQMMKGEGRFPMK